MKAHEQFLVEWFGVEGRELGCPERFYTSNPQDLLGLVEHSRATFSPCYISVQPYREQNTPCAIEKLYYDFDCPEDPERAWKDASMFSQTLKKFYNLEPLVLYSGCKGFHIYLFLNKLVYFQPGQLTLAKQAYKELQKRLVKGLNLPTLDPQVIGDIKRLARAPFSTHEKTSSLCVPMGKDREPLNPENLDVYRNLNAELLSPIIKELKTREKIASVKTSKIPKITKGIRPCIHAALAKPLEGKGGHLMRLAVAREYLAAGYNTDEIVQLFQNQPDYNPEKTRYYVEHAKKNPTKPFKCKTIHELGFCLPNCSRKTRKPKKRE
jgi:hypothetical protein